MSHELHNFRVSKWSDTACDITDTRLALFNCDSMARVNDAEGQVPYAVEVEGRSYLAYKRNASLVIGSISLADQVRLLNNAARVSAEVASSGIQVVAMNTLNAADDPLALEQALACDCRLRYEFTMDVAGYAISRISSNHKRNIRKSMKAGVTVSSPGDREAVLEHLRIVNENLEGKGVGGVSGSPDYFLSLIESDCGMLFQAHSDTELLGSTFLILNTGFAYYHSSGTSKAGRDVGVAHHIVHEAIEQLASRGIGHLNLGGATPGQQGLIRFKTGFRPEMYVLAAGRLQLGSSARRRLRSVFASGPGDLVRIETTAVFRRPLLSDQSSGQSSGPGQCDVDGRLEPVDFSGLVDLVRGTPALGCALERMSRSGDDCHAFYGAGDTLLAVLFVNRPLSTGADETALEITHIELAVREVSPEDWEACLRLLAQAFGDAACQEVVVRAASDEQAKQDFASVARFTCAGDERKWTSPLIAGVVHGFR